MALSRLVSCSMSLAGRHHGFEPARNEDALCFRKNANYAALVLADGMSSARRSKEGAAWVAGLFAGLLVENGRVFCTATPAQTAQQLLVRAQDGLRERAGRGGCEPGDFACTAVALLYARRSELVYYLSIGDSLAVIAANGVCIVPAPPEEYPAGTPSVTTEGAGNYIRAGILSAKGANALMVCSDGAWREFYRGGTIQPEYAEMLTAGDPGGIAGRLKGTQHADDCSFLAVNIVK